MCLRSLRSVVSILKVKLCCTEIDPDFTKKNFGVTRMHFFGFLQRMLGQFAKGNSPMQMRAIFKKQYQISDRF